MLSIRSVLHAPFTELEHMNFFLTSPELFQVGVGTINLALEVLLVKRIHNTYTSPKKSRISNIPFRN